MARKLNNWLKTYISYTSPLEAPDSFHFWAGVSAIAGALRRRVWLDMGLFQWTPNFYIIFVAPPGIVSKSTTLSVSMKFLREVDGVYFGPDAVTWQALTQSLAASRIDVPIGELFYPMSCITIAASEFGTFMNPHDREMVDVLVDLWDGRVGSWEKVTKTSGSDKVVNPWINLAACTTPGWLAGNFPEYLVGGGFTSRCVFVYASRKRKLVPYPIYDLPDEFRMMERALQDDLCDIAQMGGSFQLSPEARAYGERWYHQHYTQVNKVLNNNIFAGYLARKQTHIHKLAMVLSAADSSELVIEKQHLEHANVILTGLEEVMPQVFAHIGSQGNARFTQMIVDIVRSYRAVSKRELFRLCSSRMTVEEFNAAIEGAVFAGFVQAQQHGMKIEYCYVGEDLEQTPEQEANASGTGSG